MNLPRMIGQYRIVERLATGGAGEVYAGIDTKVGREVAIKFLRPEAASDPSYVDRFLAEAKSLGRLNHPNVATLYALPQEDDHICMIMELVRGRTVEQLIQYRRGQLWIRESLAIVAQVADGLSYAHEQGVIHRDIKPSNLMVTESGRVKIMDFGIARVRGSDRMTRAGSAVGTPLYMSPEQCRGLEGDERSDIYSLAIVLYELLAGAPPFKGATDFALTKAHLGTPPPPLIPRIVGVDPPLESAIMTALSKRPEQRFPSMRSFSDAIGATTLRGDATGIIHNYIHSSQGQAAAHEPPKRAPLHTVVVALMRSRAAAIVRRFRGLHPAVQGVSVGVLAMAIVAAVLLREPSAVPFEDPLKGGHEQAQSPEAQPREPPSPLPRNGQFSPPSHSLQTESAPDKASPPKVLNCTILNRDGSCYEVASNATPGAKSQAVEQNHQLQTEASNNQEVDKPKFDAGDPVRAYDEGLHYLHGDSGFPKNEGKANELIYRAADRGYTPAMAKLGRMYYDGVGVGKDPRLARKWFERAAAAGNGEAMYNLGEMCRNREAGLLRHAAKHWCQSAWEAGYHLAKQCLEDIGEKVGE
ncbi:MAG: serine/threonine-protein kinase [Pseudomonadota bacterium]|nr:serine/threonine-protein kinase [Pseudomonadota bacterium]